MAARPVPLLDHVAWGRALKPATCGIESCYGYEHRRSAATRSKGVNGMIVGKYGVLQIRCFAWGMGVSGCWSRRYKSGLWGPSSGWVSLKPGSGERQLAKQGLR